MFYFTLLVYFVNLSNPVGIEIRRWNVALEYAQPVEGVLWVVVLVLLIFPQFFGGILYFTLFFKTSDPTQRYRIALVSWSIVIWFATSFLGTITKLSQMDSWQIFSRMLGLAAALTILAAYHPPRWIQVHHGIKPIASKESRSSHASNPEGTRRASGARP